MSSIWIVGVYRDDSNNYLNAMLQYGLLPVLCGLTETFSIYCVCVFFLYMIQINLSDFKSVIFLTLSRTPWFEGQHIADLCIFFLDF